MGVVLVDLSEVLIMICKKCNGQVIWVGPMSALTHTECQECGAVNAQVEEEPSERSDFAPIVERG